MTDRSSGGETGIIQRYFAPLAKDTPGAFALTDDAGLIQTPYGQELVLTVDMIIAGVHYLVEAAPQDVAYKALAVNVSDLCAKGATPTNYLLSLAISETPDPKWLESLGQGFAEAQSDFGCRLLGGDTVHTPGPVTISVTAAGFVPQGGMVHRSGAKPGDRIYVTGTIGDATLGLALQTGTGCGGGNVSCLSSSQSDFLKQRYKRPRPRLAAIEVIRAHGHAAMDISDGLIGDFAKLCDASGVGGVIDAPAVPLSEATARWVAHAPEILRDVLTGGDDYEVLMAVSGEKAPAFERDCSKHGLQISHIGCLVPPDKGVKVLGEDGEELTFERQGYDHF